MATMRHYSMRTARERSEERGLIFFEEGLFVVKKIQCSEVLGAELIQ